MVVQHVHAEGFDEFKAKLESLSKAERLLVLFSGSKNERGESWCPDCVTADPVIRKAVEEQGQAADVTLFHVSVGGRDFWKDPKCVFRVEEPRLKTVPTLIRWGKPPRRLEEADCAKSDLVNMLIEDED